jgi:hypothetical protein
MMVYIIYLYLGFKTAPHGIIEGVADFLRLKSKFDENWCKTKGGNWSDGYSKTAFFFEWVEKSHFNFVHNLNSRLKFESWSDRIVLELTGSTIEELWDSYQKTFD